MIKLALLPAIALAAIAQTKADPARLERLLQRAVIIDLHDDTTQLIVDEGYNLAEKHDFGQVDIPRMRAGHVSGCFYVDLDRYRPLYADRIGAARARPDRSRAAARPPGIRQTSNWPPPPTGSWRLASAGTSPS